MMKKYRVTAKHTYLKEGLVIKGTVLKIQNSPTDTVNLAFLETELTESVKKGWIKEIQQPLFTEDDMKKAYHAGIDCFDRSRQGKNNVPFFEWIEKFKNLKQ